MDLNILILLLAFQVKHLIADYYLQFPYMYENKGKPTGWMSPLTDHSFVHAAITGLIVAGFTANITIALVAMMFDFVTHFVTDRIKAIQPEGPDTKRFWTNLGWDQLTHHTTGIIIIFYITCN